jgi:hypothetical protein
LFSSVISTPPQKVSKRHNVNLTKHSHLERAGEIPGLFSYFLSLLVQPECSNSLAAFSHTAAESTPGNSAPAVATIGFSSLVMVSSHGFAVW